MIYYIVLSVFLVVCVVDQVVSDFDEIIVEVKVVIRERVEARHPPAYLLCMDLVQNQLGFQFLKLKLVHLLVVDLNPLTCVKIIILFLWSQR